jgi:spore coat protein U-like protein
MCVAKFLAAALMALTVSSAMAATDTDTFDVTLTIQDACEVTADNDMSFGTQGFLDTSHTAEAEIAIRCTTDTEGIIALNGGTGEGSPTLRTMETGTSSSSIEYGLFTDNTYLTFWGDGIDGSTVSHTGKGTAETLTIYGRTSIQGDPGAGAYSDTITVTVTY